MLGPHGCNLGTLSGTFSFYHTTSPTLLLHRFPQRQTHDEGCNMGNRAQVEDEI